MATITRVDAGPALPATGLARAAPNVTRLLKAGYRDRGFYYVTRGLRHPRRPDPHPRPPPGRAVRSAPGVPRRPGAPRLAERVLVLCFSEFGRRVAENGSAGTDHGTAGPVLLAGAGVRPGLVGGPQPDRPRGRDLKSAIDFRRVYATVLDGWLGLPAEPALGRAFEPLRLFHA